MRVVPPNTQTAPFLRLPIDTESRVRLGNPTEIVNVGINPEIELRALISSANDWAIFAWILAARAMAARIQVLGDVTVPVPGELPFAVLPSRSRGRTRQILSVYWSSRTRVFPLGLDELGAVPMAMAPE